MTAAEDDEGDRHVAHVGDARIRQEPLDVALRQGDHVAESHRDDRERRNRRPEPVGQAGLENRGEHAVENQDARALRGDGEIQDGRSRHALVHVGRPGVERGERHLEAKPDEKKQEPEGDGGTGGEAGPRQRLDARASGGAEEQNDPVKGERGAEGAGQEILQAGFGGGLDAAEECGQDVEGQRQGLQSDEDDEEIQSPGHE
jgi:hypothetical protein